MNLSRIAMITGAGSGIGRASAIELSRIGFELVLVGRRLEALEETASLLQQGRSTCIAANVSIPDSVDKAFQLTLKEFGRLDLLFNNAGCGAPAVDIDELSIDDWLRCVSVNLTGSFLCARQAFRMMKSQVPIGGRIVNNGSVSAQVPRPKTVAYTATKHAITGLTKSLSLDGRAHDITCSQIDIGNANTEMVRRMPKGVIQASGQVMPEPVFDVRKCGEAVAYMASLPLDTNIQFMTIMATKMPYIGRG